MGIADKFCGIADIRCIAAWFNNMHSIQNDSIYLDKASVKASIACLLILQRSNITQARIPVTEPVLAVRYLLSMIVGAKA
jgi:hypothetical protein